MADVAGPRPVPESDLRSRVVALLIASDGAALGPATVLSSDKAVTTSGVASSALAKVEALSRAHPQPKGPLMLAFPQFGGVRGLYSVPVEVQSVDSERGFGILNLLVSAKNSGTFPKVDLPAPVPSGLLGDGEIPAEGSECDVLYNDERQKNQFFLLCLSGQVGGRTGSGFRLDLGSGVSPSILGAPVFKGGLMVGMVASAPSVGFDPSALSYNFDSHASVLAEVLSVAAMAQSEVTPAIRDLLRQLEAGSTAPRPSPRGMEISQTDAPPVLSSIKVALTPPTRATTATLGNAELFARLTSSSRNALERADQIRVALDQPTVEMEYLLYGLFENWGVTRQLFEKAKIDQRGLLRILIPLIRDSVGPELSAAFEKLESAGLPKAARLSEMPPASKHVKEALEAAVARADDRGWSRSIRSRHLLYGVLSVDHCAVVDALRERGIRKEDLDQIEDAERGLDKPILDFKISQTQASPETPERVLGANPTPKVDSDLWSEVDRLGYEAYARTIASLITHRETKPPLTIGIKAPWGAGKTTLMKRVQRLLDGYAELSEAGGTEIVQDLISEVTLQELLRALKGGLKPVKLKEKPNERGKAYGLPQRITVWFNAWKYQTSEQIWAGMAHCIITQVTARMDFKDRELFWLRLHARRVSSDAVRRKIYLAIFKYVLPYLVIFALVTLSALVLPVAWYYRFGAIVLSLVPASLASWRKYRDKAADTVRDLVNEPDYEGKMGYLHLVESDIRKVLELASASSRTEENPKGDPLVIFVDDLDRCEPNKVAEVAQAINLFLCGDYPNCIFVIGMEPGMVAAALEVANKDVIQKAEEMGLVDRTAPVGWRFMEKIVQLPIMIPPPTHAGRTKYVDSLTGLSMDTGGSGGTVVREVNQGGIGALISRPPQHGAAEEEKVQNYIRKIGPAKGASEAARKSESVVAEAPAEERWAAREAGTRIYEQTLSERDPVMSLFVDEVAQLVDGNPRQIKRYVNVFRFYCALRHSLRLEGLISSENLPSDKVLAKFVALSIQWPHAADSLRVQVDGANGQKVSRLKFLETESKKVTGDGTEADEAWKKVVGEGGLGMGAWAAERAFRNFLSRKESLCAKEGHGLW
ncbi:MAG TPA: P-loop NTPase fold protein [Candidatus Dormibacteraeota bacterium]|jgi:hypothetical protein|nr:P-loop NTPase fold protein [Candidatus Dormibacteraeota bacterium]